jgi:hypothetical protein
MQATTWAVTRQALDDDPPGPFAGKIINRATVSDLLEGSDAAASADLVNVTDELLSTLGDGGSTGHTGTDGAYLPIDNNDFFSFGNSEGFGTEGGGIPHRPTSLDDIERFYNSFAGPHVPVEGPRDSPPSDHTSSSPPSGAATQKTAAQPQQQTPTPALQLPPAVCLSPLSDAESPPAIDASIIKHASNAVPSFAYTPYNAIIHDWHRTQAELGLTPGVPHQAFAPGERVVQIFIGQLPPTVSHEVLSATIDQLLRLHSAPKILSMRPPPAGSTQSGHALLTIEAKYQRLVMSLNRRAYFTTRAIYFAAQVRDTAAFQRLVSKALSPAEVAAHGGCDGASPYKLSRACIVVEPANLPQAPKDDARRSTGGPMVRRGGGNSFIGGNSFMHPGAARGGGGRDAYHRDGLPPPPPPPYAPAAIPPRGVSYTHNQASSQTPTPVIMPGYFVYCPPVAAQAHITHNTMAPQLPAPYSVGARSQLGPIIHQRQR